MATRVLEWILEFGVDSRVFEWLLGLQRLEVFCCG